MIRLTNDPKRTNRVAAIVAIVLALAVPVGAVTAFATFPGAEIHVGPYTLHGPKCPSHCFQSGVREKQFGPLLVTWFPGSAASGVLRSIGRPRVNGPVPVGTL